ncbi:thioredoxin, variant 2-like protein [Trebouxia sp. C0010 RCD-2024]
MSNDSLAFNTRQPLGMASSQYLRRQPVQYDPDRSMSGRECACRTAELRVQLAAFRRVIHQGYTQHSSSIARAQKQQFSSFDDMVQNSELPVLVDFYATWCGPCQVMSQTLSKVSTQMAGKIKFVKIDTDKYPKVASRYAIQALPTLLVFENGQQIDRIDGQDAGRMCMNAQLLADRLQYLLFSSSSK